MSEAKKKSTVGVIHLTLADLCERLRVPVNTVYQWNRRGIGPKYLKIGRHVRYRLSDVEAWEREREHAGGAAA